MNPFIEAITTKTQQPTSNTLPRPPVLHQQRPVYQYSIFVNSNDTHKLSPQNEGKHAHSQTYKVVPLQEIDHEQSRERIRLKIEESQKRQIIKTSWSSII